MNANKPGILRRVGSDVSKVQGLSFNDHFIAGPDFLNFLDGIFMRFRKVNFALSVDIEAMFYQVSVSKEDQAVLCFPVA